MNWKRSILLSTSDCGCLCSLYLNGALKLWINHITCPKWWVMGVCICVCTSPLSVLSLLLFPYLAIQNQQQGQSMWVWSCLMFLPQNAHETGWFDATIFYHLFFFPIRGCWCCRNQVKGRNHRESHHFLTHGEIFSLQSVFEFYFLIL